jgi:hypothetical protein
MMTIVEENDKLMQEVERLKKVANLKGKHAYVSHNYLLPMASFALLIPPF